MEFFYDFQIKRQLTQFMRFMSNFCYMDGKGNIVQVPVRYGDMSRQVGAILNKNSENIIQSAPFIACYIKDLKFDRSRMQDPTFVSKMQIRERAFDETGNEFLNYQGANYTVERLMPTPYLATFNADIWTSNVDQKFQLWEQITMLVNPSIELQSSDNYIDWTSLSLLEITEGCVFESRTIPQGLGNDISVATLQFTSPMWISPPTKVKKMGIITKIINNVFAEPVGTSEQIRSDQAFYSSDIFAGMKPDSKVVVTSSDYDLLVLNNTAVLVPVGEQNVSDTWTSVDSVPNRPSWRSLLDLYPGVFTAGLSQLRLTKTNGTEIIAFISLDPTNDCLMDMNIDLDTIPGNTLMSSSSIAVNVTRGTIDAIIDPQTYNSQTHINGTRYLILEDINTGTTAWGLTFSANANDILEYDGVNQVWTIIFNSTITTSVVYITNAYTGIQYKWDGISWSKSFEGMYSNGDWRLIL